MAVSAGTEGAGRVADVLLDFLEGPDSLGVSALARDLGLSKAVVHRILRTLVQRGLLETDPETREYRRVVSSSSTKPLARNDARMRCTTALDSPSVWAISVTPRLAVSDSANSERASRARSMPAMVCPLGAGVVMASVLRQ